MTTFLDSNIWIYALNQSQDIRKHQIANHLAIQTGLYLQQFEIKRGTKMVNFKDVKKRK